MRCPKCGYISFDYNLQCPKCSTDTSLEQSKLHLPSFKPSTPFLLGALVSNEDYPVETYHNGYARPGMDGSTRSMSDPAESMDVNGDIIFEEVLDSDTTREIKTPSDFSSVPSHFRRQTDERKDLISELMPKKEGIQADDKIDDIVAEHEFDFSGADKELVNRDRSSGGDLVEGFGGLRETQQRKRQTADTEGVTREVDRNKLKADVCPRMGQDRSIHRKGCDQ